MGWALCRDHAVSRRPVLPVGRGSPAGWTWLLPRHPLGPAETLLILRCRPWGPFFGLVFSCYSFSFSYSWLTSENSFQCLRKAEQRDDSAPLAAPLFCSRQASQENAAGFGLGFPRQWSDEHLLWSSRNRKDQVRIQTSYQTFLLHNVACSGWQVSGK